MSRGPRRRFTTEFKEQVVARLPVQGATQAGVARELGITSSQPKGWWLKLEGSAEAIRWQKSEAADLAELRRENRGRKEEVVGMRRFRRKLEHRWRPGYPSVVRQKTVLRCHDTLISPRPKGARSPL